MFEEEIPEPKPLVDYAFLPDEIDPEEKKHNDIVEAYEAKLKFPQDFGDKKLRKKMDEALKKEIQNIYKRKEPEQLFVPYNVKINDESDLIGPPIPKDFNYPQTEPEVKKDIIIEDESKPSNIIKYSKPKIEDSDSDDNNDEPENEKDYAIEELSKKLPLSHVVELKHSSGKTVNSLDIDRAGNRLITASMDGTIKIFDFMGLTRRPEAFQTVDAGEGYPVLGVSWAPSGGFFVSATGDCQAKVYDRDGNFEIECLKGDNYLHDISNTRGHTYPLTDGKWHPMDRSYFITSSRDSTIRIWDIQSKPVGIDKELMQTTILRAGTFKNHKITVGCCNYSNDGNIIVGGVNDGSLQFWYNRSSYWKPDILVPNAHGTGEISAVMFFEDNLRYVSRGDDNTMKMWDLRRPKRPLYVWENLPSFSSKTGITMNEDESIIVTGTCVKKGHENSKLAFFSTYNYEKIKEIPVCQNSVVAMTWSEKINQIATSSSDGNIRIFFDPEISKNGVVNSIYKSARKHDADDFSYMKPIITPLVLPLFDETTFDRKILLDKIKPEMKAQHKADLPSQGPGSKYARPPSVTQYIMKVVNQTIYDEGDPREVLLKFGKGQGEWVDNAYKKTAPKQIYSDSPIEDEVKFYEQSNSKKCPACGLKFCQCKRTIFQLPIPKYTEPKYKNF